MLQLTRYQSLDVMKAIRNLLIHSRDHHQGSLLLCLYDMLELLNETERIEADRCNLHLALHGLAQDNDGYKNIVGRGC